MTRFSQILGIAVPSLRTALIGALLVSILFTARESLAGTLVAWGSNFYGQTDVPAGNDYIAVASGDYHSLALKRDGALVGWGYNVVGQANVPVGNDYVAIAPGQNHSLAIQVTVPEPASSLLAATTLILLSLTRSRRAHVAGALCVVLASSTYAHGTIYNLGTLGGTQSIGSDVNDSGQVTGHSYTTGNAEGHAFLYTGVPGNGGQMLDLGGGASAGLGINNSGQVTGFFGTPGINYRFAFLYSGVPGAGGYGDSLGGLAGFGSMGLKVNAIGQVTGSSPMANEAANRAFLYTGTPGTDGQMINLGTLGGSDSFGLGINDAGQVVGQSFTAGNAARHAFLYTGTPGAGGQMLDLGTLGGIESSASDINNSGQITGYSSIPGNSTQHAFLYSGSPGKGGQMIDLGTIDGMTYSAGNAINNNGQIVGHAEDSTGEVQRPFVYTGVPGIDGQMIDLEAWLDETDPAEGAKWTLRTANGISNNGWITGLGFYDDGPDGLSEGGRAYLLNASELLFPGDFNHDGVVDTADYVVWRENPGGIYTQDDYNTWCAHFGQTYSFAGAASSAVANLAVPEPGSLLLIANLFLLLISRRRKPAKTRC